MIQLNLFDAARLNHRALQIALERNDPRQAQVLLARIQQRESLDWELEALRFLQTSDLPRDLDLGWRVWLGLRSAPWFRRMPQGSATEFRKSFLSRLLASCRRQRRLLLTAEGLSVGYLLLLAGYPHQARRRLEKELESKGEFAETRLHLAWAHLDLGMQAAARAHFREALLTGWDRLDAESIPDAALLRYLRDSDDPDWAVIEGCLEGILPVPQSRSEGEFQRQCGAEFLAALACAAPRDLASRRRQFFACLAVSANCRWADPGLLIRARLRMKELNPRLHAAYMRCLGAAQLQR